MKLAQKIVLSYLQARLNLVAVVSPRSCAKQALEIFGTPLRKVRKKVPQVFVQAEALRLRYKNKWLHAYRWNPGAGKRFLILHGFESSAYNFDRYIRPMIKKGYEVVALDAPAHGRSEGTTVHLPDYIGAIAKLESASGPFDAYLCHSYGGLALTHYLEAHPPKGRVQIVFIAPATETVTAIDSFFSLLQLGPRVRAAFDKIIEERSGHKPGYFSIRRAIPHIKADILWIHDKDDPMTPLRDVEPIIKAGLPRLRFMITEGLGHRRVYRDNQVFRAVLDFF